MILWTGPLRRRLRRGMHRRLAREILSGVNKSAIDRVAAEVKNADFEKFTHNFDDWLIETVSRFDQYDLLRPRPNARLLDIGCGAGQGLLVAGKLGYSVTGLDVPGEESLARIIRVLGLEIVDHRIQPFEPLPVFEDRFEVVTIFMTSFNKLPDGTPWHCDHWDYFLRDLHRFLAPEARVIIKFNVNKMIGRHYPPDVWELVSDMDLFGAARFRDSWVLRRRPTVRVPAPEVLEEERQQGGPEIP